MSKIEEYKASPPYSLNEHGAVIDSQGHNVLVCCNDEDATCPRRFSSKAIDDDPHYMCPECGRLGLRMDDATPSQCGLGPEPACAAGETPRIAYGYGKFDSGETNPYTIEGPNGFSWNIDDEESPIVDELNRVERENAALRAALEGIMHKAVAIQKIRYGADGDCGADRLANLIEEDAERALAGKAVGK